MEVMIETATGLSQKCLVSEAETNLKSLGENPVSTKQPSLCVLLPKQMAKKKNKKKSNVRKTTTTI